MCCQYTVINKHTCIFHANNIKTCLCAAGVPGIDSRDVGLIREIFVHFLSSLVALEPVRFN